MAIKSILDSNGFLSVFNTDDGDYMRTGILNKEGVDSGIDAFQAEFPQLIDIGIMGHCKHGLSGNCEINGTQCYQSGNLINKPNMSLEDYEYLISQCQGRTFQVALGGRGDPDQHENFEEILSVSVKYGIVPNITTSGYDLTKEHVRAIKEYCGAAAVSYYKTEYMYKAIKLLSQAGVTTNLHYVLGNNSIDEAIHILTEEDIPKGIDRIIFLLHKPVGVGSKERILQWDDPRVKNFFKLLTNAEIAEKTGFDSCCVPAIVTFCPEIAHESFDACESGRFSAYVDSECYMSPCSFDKSKKIMMSLKKMSIEQAWNSKEFQNFRYGFKTRCTSCKSREFCLGGCPLCSDINLCGRYAEISS